MTFYMEVEKEDHHAAKPNAYYGLANMCNCRHCGGLIKWIGTKGWKHVEVVKDKEN